MRKLWFILLIVILLVAFNAERIGRHYYPFPYQETIYFYSQEHRIDPYLLAAIIRIESNFNPEAVSPKGAVGLMQIMPDTGRWITEQMQGPAFDPQGLLDPETNIRMGCWYLANLYDNFGGDPVLVLAAYNGGRGNVSNWLKEARWSGEAHTLDQIPFPETRQYVRKVLATYRIYNFLYRG